MSDIEQRIAERAADRVQEVMVAARVEIDAVYRRLEAAQAALAANQADAARLRKAAQDYLKHKKSWDNTSGWLHDLQAALAAAPLDASRGAALLAVVEAGQRMSASGSELFWSAYNDFEAAIRRLDA